MSRRAFLAGSVGLVVVAGCGGGSADSLDGALLVPGFPDGIRAPSFLVAEAVQNAPFFVRDSSGAVVYEGLPALDVQVIRDGVAVDSQRLLPRGEGIPTPHYTLTVDVDRPGGYSLATNFGGRSTGFDFVVQDAAQSRLIAVGEQMRPADSPTFDDPRGVSPICTRLPDPCPFHTVTVTEALAEGRPLALLVSTPAFCQTVICGPVLELLIAASQDFPNMRFIHAEVWRSEDDALQPGGEAPVMEAYGLTYEPSLLVVDGDGRLARRLDLAFDAQELREALQAGRSAG